jgi:hypothetical protein
MCLAGGGLHYIGVNMVFCPVTASHIHMVHVLILVAINVFI